MSTSNDGWQSLIQLCYHARSEDALQEIFEFFFTAEEKTQFANRLSLIRALMTGKHTQREIATTLGISIAKITRGSRELKRCSAQFRRYLETVFKL